MAPRSLVRVKGPPKLRENHVYPVKVRAVRDSDEPRGFVVGFQFLKGAPKGYVHEWLLKAEIFSSELAGDFFRACGIGPIPKKKIDPQGTVGTTLRVWFSRLTDGRMEIVAFQPDCDQKVNAGQQKPGSPDVPGPSGFSESPQHGGANNA